MSPTFCYQHESNRTKALKIAQDTRKRNGETGRLTTTLASLPAPPAGTARQQPGPRLFSLASAAPPHAAFGAASPSMPADSSSRTEPWRAVLNAAVPDPTASSDKSLCLCPAVLLLARARSSACVRACVPACACLHPLRDSRVPHACARANTSR